jgi:hypothetical protein
MALPSRLTKVVSWLRAGYPRRAPRHGYVPVMALMPGKAANLEKLPGAGTAPAPGISRSSPSVSTAGPPGSRPSR